MYWFWNLTTKWWFFPIFSLLLSFFVEIILEPSLLYYPLINIQKSLTITLHFMPIGLLNLIHWPIDFLLSKLGVPFIFSYIMDIVEIVFYAYISITIFRIVETRRTENKILKRQIKLLFFIILLSFLGIILDRYYSVYF